MVPARIGFNVFSVDIDCFHPVLLSYTFCVCLVIRSLTVTVLTYTPDACISGVWSFRTHFDVCMKNLQIFSYTLCVCSNLPAPRLHEDLRPPSVVLGSGTGESVPLYTLDACVYSSQSGFLKLYSASNSSSFSRRMSYRWRVVLG